MACYKVSLNDSETERESLGKRLQTAEAKADQFDQVAFDPQTWNFSSKVVSIQVDQQNQHLAQEVGELTKKNEFLFGEIAKERVTEIIPKKRMIQIKAFPKCQPIVLNDSSRLT